MLKYVFSINRVNVTKLRVWSKYPLISVTSDLKIACLNIKLTLGKLNIGTHNQSECFLKISPFNMVFGLVTPFVYITINIL